MPGTSTTSTSSSVNRERGPAPKRGAKRESTDGDSTTKTSQRKKAKTSEPVKQEAAEGERRPRLTTLDLEFDYDRSQLRDPRITPGRIRRPRLQGYEVTEEFKQRFFTPTAGKPKGRLNAYQKDQIYKKQALLDPTMTFHDLYVCYERGPRGSPTFDSAGFQLDYEKVAGWMKPQSYNKKTIMRGSKRSLERIECLEQELTENFFVEDDRPDPKVSFTAMNYVKDHVSKDLGVPWHQIGTEHAHEWRRKGFERKKYSEWWREPTTEERRRMSRVMSGASLRKDL